MSEKESKITKELKDLTQREENLRSNFKLFCRKLEDSEDFMAKEIKKNDEMFEVYGGDSQLAKILEEKDSILRDMKSDCYSKFEAVEYEYNKSIKDINTKTEKLRYELSNAKKGK